MLLNSDNLDQYLSLFYNAIISCTIFSVEKEYMAGSMRVFGYNSQWIFFISLIGEVIAGSINYFVGFFLNKIPFLNSKKMLERKEALLLAINSYISILALFMFIDPVNKALTLLLGFLKFNYIKFFSFWLIARLIICLINIYLI